MTELKFSFKDMEGYKYVRDSVSKFLKDTMIENYLLVDVAINEAVNNALLYSDKQKRHFITLSLRKTKDTKLIIRIRDEGSGFSGNQRLKELQANTDKIIEQNLFGESGRGLFIMHLVTDYMTFNKQGNEVLMVKNLKVNNSQLQYEAKGEIE